MFSLTTNNSDEAELPPCNQALSQYTHWGRPGEGRGGGGRVLTHAVPVQSHSSHVNILQLHRISELPRYCKHPSFSLSQPNHRALKVKCFLVVKNQYILNFFELVKKMVKYIYLSITD